jgi:hypothetical protein
MFKFLLLGLGFMLFGCASRNYYQSDKWIRNNMITIKSDNMNNNTLINVDQNTRITIVDESLIMIEKLKKKKQDLNITYIEIPKSTNNLNVLFDGFKQKDLKVRLTHPDYEQVDLLIKKRPRLDAFIADLSVGVLTFGLPFIIDPFKSDFYRIKKSSQNFNIHFEYNQSFMKKEFVKISSSKNINDFNNWINKYQKSEILQNVIDHKDSLEFSSVLSVQNEASIDDFITTHQKSKYLNEALAIKNEMQAAREMFDSVSIINTVESFEIFLNKFPKSIYVKDAQIKLLATAENQAIKENSVEFKKKYILNYLIKYSNLYKNKEIEEKKLIISNSIDEQLITEHIKNIPNESYTEYSNLWKAYINLKKEVPSSFLLELSQTKSYHSKICDLLAELLKESNTPEKQKLFVTKVNQDFPEFVLTQNNGKDLAQQTIICIINNTKKASGVLKLFNVSFLKYYFESSKDLLNDNNKKSFFDYKNQKYDAFEYVDLEEVSIKDGKLEGTSKCFSNSKIVLTVNYSDFIPKEINYFLDEKKVNTCFFDYDKTKQSYSYQFENGINLTLKELDYNISKEQELLNKGLDEGSIERIQSLRNNKYPASLNQNKQLDKLIIKAQNLIELENKRKEELRLAENKKKEEIRLAEQKKREEERRQQAEAQKRRETQKNNSYEETNESVLSEEDAQTLLFAKLVGFYESNDGNWVALYPNKTGKLRIEDNLMGLGSLVFTWAVSGESLSIKFQNEYGMNQTVFLSLIPRGSIYDLKYRTMTGGIQFIKTR